MRYLTTILCLAFICVPLAGQNLLTDWTDALSHTAHPFALADDNTTDLHFLQDLLRDKRVVLLGEFNHGSKEINQVKFRTIRYLHEQLGFSVVLLESGIGEVFPINGIRTNSQHTYWIYRLIGPWQSKEFLEFTEYLQDRPDLMVGGFDPQRSGSSFGRYVQARLNDIDTTLGHFVRTLEDDNNAFARSLRRTALNDSMRAVRADLVDRYHDLEQMVAKFRNVFAKDVHALISRTIENRIAYLSYYGDLRNRIYERFDARDSVMAANVLWYVNELYPKEKIIISAHNYHIARSNEKAQVMGEWLSRELGDEAYVIGVFGGRGQFANNARRPQTLTPPARDYDIKTICALLPGEAALIDIPESRQPSSSWTFEPLRVETFVDLNGTDEIVLSKKFDAVLLVKDVSPSVYEW